MSEEIEKDVIEISEEQQSLLDEMKEITEEFRVDNKEILEILKSDLYKTLWEIFKRATIKIEIVNIDQLSTGNISPGEKIDSTQKKDKSESIKFQNITLVDQTEKAFKYRNEAFEICWFAKKGVKYNEDTKELEVLGWWIDFVNSKSEPIEFKKESK